MKAIKISILFFFTVLFSAAAYAQKTGFYWNNLNENSNRFQGKLKGELYNISALGNDKFFFQKDWKVSTITLTDGDVFENVKLRYLAFGDQFIAYNDNVRTLFKIEKETIKQITYNDSETNTTIKFVRICSGELESSCRFYQELYSGNSKLMAFHFVEELKVTPYNDNHGMMRDSEYRMNTSYFLYNNELGFVRIQKNRRSFQKNFPDKKKEIRKILRKNKIILIDQNSMLQAFTLLDKAGLFN